MSFLKTFVTFVALFTSSAVLSFPHTYYVSTKGSDKNNGSKSSPFRTLLGANNYFTKNTAHFKKDRKTIFLNVLAGRYTPGYIQKSYRYKVNSSGHVTPGMITRWSFHNYGKGIVVQGAGVRETIFDGYNAKGPYLFLSVHNNATNYPMHITFTKITIANYHTAAKIFGRIRSTSGSIDNRKKEMAKFDTVRFLNIGGAYDTIKDIPSYRKAKTVTPSRAAIYMNNTSHNTVTRSSFLNISNVSFYQNKTIQDVNDLFDLDTAESRKVKGTRIAKNKKYEYGGLHAIYLDRSSNIYISHNSFKNVYARGVIKFRDSSHNGSVHYNRFYDNTSLITDQYCTEDKKGCERYASKDYGCPTRNIRVSGNKSRFNRKKHRKNIEIEPVPLRSENNYQFCKTKDKKFGVSNKKRIVGWKNYFGSL